MNTENDKNISVTLKTQEENNDSSIFISFGSIFRQLKRYLSLWLVVSIICAFLTMGFTLYISRSTSSDTITALISYNYSNIKSGLDPKGNELDVNKIKSPNIIEASLTTLNMPIEYVENVRRNITIDGIIPSEDLDKISLYQDAYSKSSYGLEAINALLNINYFPSYYIVNFDNNAAGFNLDDGKKIIDEILSAYQEYFFTTYGYNEAFGNSVSVIDYKDYDYPAAIDVFKSALDELDLYIQRLQVNDTIKFRSSKTGFNFEDIRRNIETLKSADLDSLSSYITVNNVTNDKEKLVTYYEYKIDNLQREFKVTESELKSITNSIDTYEKDTMHVFGDVSETEELTLSQASEKYDELISQKINTQEKYSRQKNEIDYYKSRISDLDSKSAKKDADVELVKTRLDDLYNKINNITNIAIDTSDEFYANVVFENAFNILVPATGEAYVIKAQGILTPVLIAEAIIFVIYLSYAFISAILNDTRKNAKKTAETKDIEAKNS